MQREEHRAIELEDRVYSIIYNIVQHNYVLLTSRYTAINVMLNPQYSRDPKAEIKN